MATFSSLWQLLARYGYFWQLLAVYGYFWKVLLDICSQQFGKWISVEYICLGAQSIKHDRVLSAKKSFINPGGQKLMKNWWRNDVELMKNWWQTNEELINNEMMKNWWRIDDRLMRNWWRRDEHQIKNWWICNRHATYWHPTTRIRHSVPEHSEISQSREI